jgi:hypothetical protein
MEVSWYAMRSGHLWENVSTMFSLIKEFVLQKIAERKETVRDEISEICDGWQEWLATLLDELFSHVITRPSGSVSGGDDDIVECCEEFLRATATLGETPYKF